jgi:hypothetical protein
LPYTFLLFYRHPLFTLSQELFVFQAAPLITGLRALRLLSICAQFLVVRQASPSTPKKFALLHLYTHPPVLSAQ